MDDDSNSGWSGVGDFFSGLARTAGDVYTTTQNRNRKPETRPAPQPVQKTDWSKIAIVGIAVVAGIAALGIVAKMFGK